MVSGEVTDVVGIISYPVGKAISAISIMGSENINLLTVKKNINLF